MKRAKSVLCFLTLSIFSQYNDDIINYLSTNKIFDCLKISLSFYKQFYSLTVFLS